MKAFVGNIVFSSFFIFWAISGSAQDTKQVPQEVLDRLFEHRDDPNVLYAFDHRYGAGTAEIYLNDTASEIQEKKASVIPAADIEYLISNSYNGSSIAAFDIEHGAGQAKFLLGENLEKLQLGSKKIFEYYHGAAEDGHAMAQLKVSKFFYSGKHVPQSYISSYVWSSIAAANGNELAITQREKSAERLEYEYLMQAQKLTAICFKSNYRKCDYGDMN
ncbi:hypothetical protein N9769_08650 [Ascidiaceihabitans sp.]|nr:hypothetical protein [Ascidiaceihabitans sp.]